MNIEDVLDRHRDKLMETPGVVGVGIGESQGIPVIIVMVDQLTPELKSRLPEKIEGFTVKVEVTGEITAF